VRDSSFYPSALDKGSRTEQAVNLALAASIFPNPASCLRLVSALLAECDEEWMSGKIYLNFNP
jgi:transposase-like protein